MVGEGEGEAVDRETELSLDVNITMETSQRLASEDAFPFFHPGRVGGRMPTALGLHRALHHPLGAAKSSPGSHQVALLKGQEHSVDREAALCPDV